ncbi:MAG: nucleotidyl transferase AbiEii/AbiGii toxin family protein [Lacisediminihabitans sp.]
MKDDEDLQRELTRVALTALDGRSFALAGSGAIREHGIVDRLTHDVDLFTNDTDPAAFDSAVEELIGELRRAGYDVDDVRRASQFAQLRVTTVEGRSVDMDLAVDWREREPVTLSVGPVLSVEDAMGSKVSALYTRTEARDYIDVDAIRSSGRFSDAELMAAAADRDAGFEVEMFGSQLEQIHRITPDRFAEYDVDSSQFDALRRQGRQFESARGHHTKPLVKGRFDFLQLHWIRRVATFWQQLRLRIA